MDNDIVLIDQGKRDVTPGRLYAIGFDEAIYLKRIDILPGKVILKSTNAAYPPVELDTQGDCGDAFRVIARPSGAAGSTNKIGRGRETFWRKFPSPSLLQRLSCLSNPCWAIFPVGEEWRRKLFPADKKKPPKHLVFRRFSHFSVRCLIQSFFQPWPERTPAALPPHQSKSWGG